TQISGGQLQAIIIQQIQSSVQSWANSNAPETLKLLQGSTWSNAAIALQLNITKIISIVWRTKSNIMFTRYRNPKFEWLILMPTPVESFILNPTFESFPLPGIRINTKKIRLAFGGGSPNNPDSNGGKYRGRLFGLGMWTQHDSSKEMIFRMDYHTPHFSSDPNYFEHTEGDNTFHFHFISK
ncbi:MAG: hypothetical protein LBU34_07130, partial [Planctomycetaceae bacterium]|nr:hypothetical protein [Planctomycetaceae bacterium]